MKSPITATYSIVAVDPATGIMGAAVQSHFFSVRPAVIWGEPGTGIVLTQAMVNRDAGPRGLELLRDGGAPEEVLAEILAEDPHSETRQIAIVSPHHNAVAFTGYRCIRCAGHVREGQVAIIANMMAHPGVPEAMMNSWTATSGERLEDRLLKALTAAEAAGGDIRGRQSAGMAIYSMDSTAPAHHRWPLDLSVADHQDPLGELERLLRLHHGYGAAEAGDSALAANHHDEALSHYREARHLCPDSEELEFWNAVGLGAAGEVAAGRAALHTLFARARQWYRLACRVPPAALFPLDSRQWDALLGHTPGTVLHVMDRADWEARRHGDTFTGGSPEAERFIHCCFPHQLEGVLVRWFSTADLRQLVVLEMHLDDLSGTVRMEAAEDTGEEFPHVYGEIPTAVIRSVRDLTEEERA